MRVLGIDPGSRVTGWALLDSDGWDVRLAAHGAIRCPSGAALPDRLRLIGDGLDGVIRDHEPEVVAVEQVFHARNARAALVLGQARGVALLSAARAAMPLHEYSPMQVKSSVTGYGRADKRQVQQALATQLALRELPRPQDAADAIAVAVCHAATIRLNRHLGAAGLAAEAPGSSAPRTSRARRGRRLR